MRIGLPSALLATIAATIANLGLVAGAAAADRHVFYADLADPGGGDPDGSGAARITIDLTEGLPLCWHATVKNLGPGTHAHLHIGAVGEEGDVFLDIPAAPGGGCRGASDADLEAIIANPASYYIDVHTTEYPDGAIRGQLTTEAPDTAMESPAGSPLGVLGLLLLSFGGLLWGWRLAERLRERRGPTTGEGAGHNRPGEAVAAVSTVPGADQVSSTVSR